MFTESAANYDAIYASIRDFPAEADKLHVLIEQHKQSAGTALLDVVCGTGAHLAHLRR